MGVRDSDSAGIAAAITAAKESYREHGIPIGSALISDGKVVATGHNLRVQSGDPTSHAEIVCLRELGRVSEYAGMTLVSTLSPCYMCAGAVIQFEIPRVIALDNENFAGAADLMLSKGVDLVVVADQSMISLMAEFINANPVLWAEDIADVQGIVMAD